MMNRLRPLSFAVFILAACSSGSAPGTRVGADGAWTNRTQGARASNQLWTAVASDASGSHLVATSRIVVPPSSLGGCWTSGDAGRTWTLSDECGVAEMGAVASNAAGTVLLSAAGDLAGISGLYLSTSSGSSWSESSAPGPTGAFVAVASDAAGATLVALDFGGDVWTSRDSGTTWSEHAPSGPAQVWVAVASDSTGERLVAVTAGAVGAEAQGSPGDIWTSTDSGVTWNDKTPSGPAHDGHWSAVASDATGANLVAVGDDVWTSTDAGATWSRRATAATNTHWTSVASDSTGTRLVAATGVPGTGQGDLWRSLDRGVTWTNQTAGTSAENQAWTAVASDASGTHLVAVPVKGDVWTSDGAAP